jgi:hypothetical protein
LTQALLLVGFFYCRAPLLAVYALWSYSPLLFGFYGLGLIAQLWLLVTAIKRYLLLRSVGRKAEQAARTRGF